MLPGLLDLFLCLDVSSALTESIQTCQCLEMRPGGIGAANDLPQAVALPNSDCLIESLTQAGNFTLITPSSEAVSYCGRVGSSGLVVPVQAIGIAGMLVIALSSAVLYFRRNQHWTMLVVSFTSGLTEALSIGFLVQILNFFNSNEGNEFANRTRFLQLGVLFSTLFAFIVNIVSEGDAAVLTAMGYKRGSPLRYFVLAVLQVMYLIATGLNVYALIVGQQTAHHGDGM